MAKNKKAKAKPKSKVQHIHWKDPYQPGSNLHTFHQAMMKKGGLPHKDFEKLIKKTGASRNFILRAMRRELSRKGWTWEFDDSRGRYRITNVIKHKKGV